LQRPPPPLPSSREQEIQKLSQSPTESGTQKPGKVTKTGLPAKPGLRGSLDMYFTKGEQINPPAEKKDKKPKNSAQARGVASNDDGQAENYQSSGRNRASEKNRAPEKNRASVKNRASEKNRRASETDLASEKRNKRGLSPENGQKKKRLPETLDEGFKKKRVSESGSLRVVSKGEESSDQGKSLLRRKRRKQY
jgi:hypothetical protein